MKKDNNTAVLRALSREEAYAMTAAAGTPFAAAPWDEELMRAFPYMAISYFLYRGTHVLRLAHIENRFTTVPFSDGGDVFALGEAQLSLPQFADDVKNFFDEMPTIRVHEWFARALPAEGFSADIVDFRVPLAGFGAGSLRKTLRHIVSEGVPKGCDITFATTEKDMKTAYTLYLKTMRRVGALALPFRAFAYLGTHAITMFLVDGVPHAAALCLSGEKTVHYFLSMADAIGKKHNAAHHMLFKNLKRYAELGKEAMFLGGTRTGSSLQTFKEGWRGEPCAVFTVAPHVARESARQSPLRSLWRFVPLFLLPEASKYAGKYVF